MLHLIKYLSVLSKYRSVWLDIILLFLGTHSNSGWNSTISQAIIVNSYIPKMSKINVNSKKKSWMFIKTCITQVQVWQKEKKKYLFTLKMHNIVDVFFYFQMSLLLWFFQTLSFNILWNFWHNTICPFFFNPFTQTHQQTVFSCYSCLLFVFWVLNLPDPLFSLYILEIPPLNFWVFGMVFLLFHFS